MSKANRCFNFAPGPAVLPLAVLETIEKELYDWKKGMSVMECSHRSKEVILLKDETDHLLRALLGIPQDYHILYVPGGARTQFSAIPLNCLGQKKALYINSGTWSKQASREAKRYGQVEETEDLENLYQYYKNEYAYIHYTDNETIEGVEFHQKPDVGTSPLITDMTSNLMTKAIDVSQFGLIYAACQKNLGIAGLTLVIIHKDLIGHAHPLTPLMLNYEDHDKAHSLLNTMPVFPLYVMNLMLKWQAEQGGVDWADKRAVRWSNQIYQIIDGSKIYENTVDKKYRSRINIPFSFIKPELESIFLLEAERHQLMNLKGHASKGGVRVCLYLGMTEEGVQRLTEFMQSFEKHHG